MDSDVLSDVLRSLRATGTVYFCDQLEPPWIKQYSGDSVASFHQVRRGGCWLRAAQLERYLGPGDLVFIAPGIAHTISSDQMSHQTENNIPTAFTDTLLLCGYCDFDSSLSVPLSDLFPQISVIRDSETQAHGWLRTLLDNISAEYMSRKPGTRIVVNKLTEVFLVELIRLNFGQQKQTPLLKALANKQIAKALHLMHEDPAKAWSLESLAAQIGMSRAGFAKRFKELVEHSMFEYLTQLRLQRACELLANTQLNLYTIANRVGYESDLAFTRTFKKKLGLTPTAYRKNRNEQTGSVN